MKFNKITAALLTVIAHTASSNAFADTIIQKGGGDFYIVSNQEADALFNANNFGFFAVAPSPIVSTKSKPHARIYSAAKKKAARIAPVINHPVANVESAESIFLRLEKKTHEN
ncbi:hypothetical protein F4826_004740 [Rahnella inusitata]|nr:hypothetical protein [Rahnella inusitata]